MEKKSENFSMQEALRLAKSPAGQQLLTTLQQTNGDTLQQAMTQAGAGDYENLRKTLASLMENEEVKALINRLGG